MRLDQVVPWGRSYDEYVAMFALDHADLRKSILGCGDGPAAFNAELTSRGGKVVSVDPAYRLSADQFRCRIDAVYADVLAQVAAHRQQFIWTRIRNVAALGRQRMQAMQEFLQDYEQGKNAGRYIHAALPVLPFADQQFDLALCGHFLFLYSDYIDWQAHVDAVLELCRVAREVRIYPLLTLDNRLSPHLEAVREALQKQSLQARLLPVAYRFQRGADRMLVISASNRYGNDDG